MQSFQPVSSDTDYIDLGQCWKALRRRWLPATCVAGSVIGLVATATSFQQPIYEAQGQLLFNKNNKTSSLAGLSQETSELSGLTNQSNPLSTQAAVIRSSPLIQRTIDSLKLTDSRNQPLSVKAFLGNLKIKPLPGTDILSISYRSKDAKSAAAIINRLMSLYLDNDIINNRAEAKAAREFITEQLPAVETKVTGAESKLRQFQEKNGIVSLKEEAKSAIGVMSSIENELAQSQAALADAQRRAAVLQQEVGMTPSQAVELSNLNQSKEVQTVLTEYRKVQDELALERLRYQDTAPRIEYLSSKEAVLKQQLQQRVSQTIGNRKLLPEPLLQMGKMKQDLAQALVTAETERLGLADRVAALSNVYQSYRSRLQVVPQLSQTQRQLERELKASQSTYEQLLKKLQEVQVVENQNVGNAKIMAGAVTPKQPVAPHRAKNIALGSFLGLTLGAGTALLLDAKDKSLKTVDDVEKMLGYALLGRIPTLPTPKAEQTNQQELPVRDNPYSPASAAYEMLQATLDFALPDQELKQFVVTSAVPGEGKSTVSSNLAVAMAQMGRRVLIVDADLRRPRQHQIWQIPNLVGLSDVLVGRAEFASAIREVMVNVDLLCCGTIPPNPSALLGSRKMTQLLDLWASHYDCVIIDTPPVTFFPDALKLGQHVNGILPVVRPGLIESKAASNMSKLLQQASLNVLGMVVNATSSNNDSEGYLYQHSYYYRGDRHPEMMPPETSETSGLLSQAEPGSRQI